MEKIHHTERHYRLPIYSKSILLALLMFFSVISTNAMSDGTKLNLSFKDASLAHILKEIKKQTQFDFMYNAQEIDTEQKLSVELKNVSLDSALKVCLNPFKLTYVIKDKIIILKQQKQISHLVRTNISGIVKDKQGMPLPGVAVILQGTTLGTVTHPDGRFQITVPNEKCTLNFTFIGMKAVQREIDGEQFISVIMEEDVAELDEVVVTGMETIKKDYMTGSASVITAKDIRSQGITSIDKLLEGAIAGLNSTTLSGAPGTRSKITIRGENNLSGRTEPLWIVDGLPLMSGVPENSTGDYAGTIMQDGVGNIMPEDIESITILKDASAASIYGAKAANGVIVITTKKGFRSKTQFNYTGNYSLSEAPRLHMDFMNSREKLQYERDIMDTFGLTFAKNTGRGGYLYKQLLEGYITQKIYDEEINKLRNTNTNWFNVLFRSAQSHSHNLSIRGGSEEMTYYASVNYQEKNGILLSNKYSNAGILMKLDYRPIKNLILALDINANIRKSRDHASAIDPFKYAIFANRYERPYDENVNYAADLSYLGTNYTETTASGYKYDSFNILRELNETKSAEDGLDASLTFNIRYDIIPGLAISSIIRKGASYNTSTKMIEAGTYTSYAQESFAKQVFSNQEVIPSEYNNGELSESSGKNFNWSIRNQIDYSFNIKNEHLFTVLVAHEVTSKKFNNFGYTSPMYYGDYRITGVPNFDMDVDYETLRSQINDMFNTSIGQDRTVSFLGSFRYGYKDRYVFNFNYRADGANAIGDANRFTPLWSVGLRYNLHHEKFFKNSIITELSIRGSYGYTGNIDRTAYPFATITLGSDTYEGNRFATNFTYPNPSVNWEKKLDRNFGVDITFFKGKLNFTMDYYNNRTKNILENLTIPISTGRPTVKANGGTVENSGLEFFISSRLINTTNLTFSISTNIARNKNVIIRSEHDYTSYSEAINSNVLKGGVVNIVGKETGAIYGWKTAGVDPLSGNPLYYLTPAGKRAYAQLLDKWDSLIEPEKEGYQASGAVPSLTSVPDYVAYNREAGSAPQYFTSSMQYLGRSNPKYVGGINTYLRYKNLEFSTQWSYKIGHIIPSFNDLQNAPNNNANSALVPSASYSGDLAVSSTNRERRYLSFWKTRGDITNIARFVSSGNDYWAGMATSDKYEKGDYIRLTNISLSYRLPAHLVQRFGMKNMSLSFNAYNLLTFTKYKGMDVGTGGSFAYPTAREYNIKLSVGF